MVIQGKITKKYDTIMFDIDYTLVYFDTLEKLSREALNEYKYTGREYEIGHLRGVSNLLKKSRVNKNYFSLENYIAEQQESMGICKEDTTKIINRMLELTPQYTKLYDGVLETLHTLDQDLICVSDWFAQIQLNKLTKVGIDQWFRKLYTCEGQFAKPSKERFISILKEEGLNAKNTVMVGDGSNDLGALDAGIDTIIVKYLDDKKGIIEDSAVIAEENKKLKRSTAIITDIRDLTGLLRR